MPSEVCATHPAAAAAFACDGCGKLLCHDCIREGHRLLFCRLCGERALPLAPAGPATTPERRQETVRHTSRTLADVLLYPLRGAGGRLFGTLAGLFVAFALIDLLPVGCAVIALLRCVIVSLLPGLLFAIVRRTATGDDEVPDWPDIMETGDRLREVVAFLGVGLLALAPAAALLQTSHCGAVVLLAGGPHGRLCWFLFALGFALGLALAIPAVVAEAVYQSLWLVPRVDLHARLLVAAGVDSLATLGLVLGILALSQLAARALATVPLLGGALEGTLVAYALFVGAHRIGLLARRHDRELDATYLGDDGRS